MKFRLGLLTLTALAPLAAHAQPIEGIYIGAGAGFDYLNSFKSKSFTTTGPAVAPLGVPSVTFNPRDFSSQGGFVGLASVGFGLGNGLRLELEGNYRQNHVKAKSSVPGGGNLEQAGGFFNALYDFDLGLGFLIPYVGLGVGYEQNIFQGGSIYSRTAFPEQVGVNFNNNGDGSVAGQAILGASFPITYALSLTTEFRFMGEFSDTKLDARPTLGGGLVPGAGKEKVKFDNLTNESFLVGLRYSFDAAPPAPPPAPAPVAPPAPPPARTYLVFFDWDRADLTDRARQIIAEAATNSTKVQVTRIEVNGYTDLSGTAAYNQKLSVRRANAVAAELVKDGVPKSEITAQGFGESNPLVPTAKGVREPQNRRVEIIFK